jgi:hypothetical protein
MKIDAFFEKIKFQVKENISLYDSIQVHPSHFNQTHQITFKVKPISVEIQCQLIHTITISAQSMRKIEILSLAESQ